MTQEEKAKAYDGALERAKEKYAMFEGMKQGDVLEDVFPELREECIRKEIINFIDTNTIDSDERRYRWFSYLEKCKPISFTSSKDTKVR